jgi:pilus assembly protein CpaB
MLAGLLLLTALGLGLVGYQATRPPVTIRVAAEAAVPPLTVDILVAAHSLPAGTLMKEEDFSQRAVPPADVPPGVLTNSPEVRAGLHGALLRRYLDLGSSLMAGDILHPRDRGFLAAVLAPDARAVSVAVDAVTGNGGLIWPGDRVDLILTQELGEKNVPPSRHFVAETVLSDVRVVAVDQSIIQGAVATGDNATGRLARTVTLEVTPEQAERAVVAEHLGRITLAIRAVNGIADAPGHHPAVYGGDVSAALADSAPHMRVVEGKDDREVTFQRPPASPLITPSWGSANARPQPL